MKKKILDMFKTESYKDKLLKQSEEKLKIIIKDMAAYLCRIEELYKKTYYLEKMAESYKKQLEENEITPIAPDIGFECDFIKYMEKVKDAEISKYANDYTWSPVSYNEFKEELIKKYFL